MKYIIEYKEFRTKQIIRKVFETESLRYGYEYPNKESSLLKASFLEYDKKTNKTFLRRIRQIYSIEQLIGNRTKIVALFKRPLSTNKNKESKEEEIKGTVIEKEEVITHGFDFDYILSPDDPRNIISESYEGPDPIFDPIFDAIVDLIIPD